MCDGGVIEEKIPRVLVVSFSCFSQGGSNGRTLGNLFYGWKQDCLAQVYMSKELPDSEVCGKYYRITDIDLMNTLRLKKTSGEIKPDKRTVTFPVYSSKQDEMYQKWKQKKGKDRLKYKFFRALLWDTGLWKTRKFICWLKEYSPEVILYMAGENFFGEQVARYIAKKFNIPIVVYNSEDYQFKDYRKFGIFGIIFKKMMVTSFTKLVKKTSYFIFSNEPLLELFRSKYEIQGSVLYISSSINPGCCMKRQKVEKVAYLGNIDRREDSLIRIANVLYQINDSLHVDVYGKIMDEDVLDNLKRCSCLQYHGVVSYEDVQKVIFDSDILLHCESFNPEEAEDRKYAFSTKIGDSMMSGSCLLFYAPASNAAAQYLQKNNAACVITQENDLKKYLYRLVNDEDYRNEFRMKAGILAEQYHDIKKNAAKVKEIIIGILNEEK